MISKSQQKRIDKMNDKLAAALIEEVDDDDDDRRIRGAQSGLLYAVSTGDDQRIANELSKLDQKWAVWATTGTWPLFDQPLQGRIDNMLRALDDALVDEKDPDDEHKILAAKARLVAALAAEDLKRSEAEVTATEKDHAVWATSGTWPAMTLKPSKPSREPDIEAKIEAAKLEGEALAEVEVARNWKIAKWGFGTALGIFVWKLWR